MQQDAQHVSLTVSSHDAAILECSVQGDNPPSVVDWSGSLDNEATVQLPNGNLLVKSFNEPTNPFLCTNLIEDNNRNHFLLYSVNVNDDGQFNLGLSLCVFD